MKCQIICKEEVTCMNPSNLNQIPVDENKPDKDFIDIDILKSPMKYEILSLLNDNEMSFEDIVENTSKSKTSISIHLKSLREIGLVDFKLNPNDNRKKIFFINTKTYNKAKKISENKMEEIIEEFIKNEDLKSNIKIITTLKAILHLYNIEISPVLKSIGNYMGKELSLQLHDEDLKKYTENIKRHWYENKLGELNFNIDEDIKITCKNCFECKNTPITGKSSCDIVNGIFKGLFENYFNFKLKIIESKCYSMGDDECLFELTPY